MQSGFSEIGDSRRSNLSYPLLDLLNLGFAMFHLKDGSMSSFKEQYSVRAANLARLYGVTALPGDTAFREGLDQVHPQGLQGLFKPALDFLKTQGVFPKRQVLGSYTVVSVDGTGHYCSGVKGCPQCMIKNHSNVK